MITEILHITDPMTDIGNILRAAQILKQGGLVSIPTETVYGLAANALDARAVAGIFKAKGRPSDNPIIVHVSDTAMLLSIVKTVPPAAQALIEAFWPGPLTIVFEKKDIVPDIVSAGLPTVAVRMPSHPVARAIIAAAGVPLAAPSANLSTSPSPTSYEHTRRDLGGRVDALVYSCDCAVGVESTVLSFIGERPVILRPGGVTVEELRGVIPDVKVADTANRELETGETALSPGMKYRHYAPKAKVVLVRSGLRAFITHLRANLALGVYALCFCGEEDMMPCPCVTMGQADDPGTQAQRLFAALRELDDKGALVAYARCPKSEGVGLAVYNRLIKAAGYEVIEL